MSKQGENQPSKGITVICNNCGNEITINEQANSKYCEESGFYLLAVQSDTVNICCMRCDNEIYIF